MPRNTRLKSYTTRMTKIQGPNEAGNENRNKIVKNQGSLYLGETI